MSNTGREGRAVIEAGRWAAKGLVLRVEKKMGKKIKATKTPGLLILRCVACGCQFASAWSNDCQTPGTLCSECGPKAAIKLAGGSGASVICPACGVHVALGTCCSGCSVYFGDPCPTCEGVGYHDRSCAALDDLGDAAAYR